MFFNIILNAVVLGVTILVVTKGQNKPDLSILLGLPIGLGILSGVISMYIGMYGLIISFGICVFALRAAFDLTTKQSLIVTTIWIVWQVVFSII